MASKEYKLLLSAPSIQSLEKQINKFYYSTDYKIINLFDDYILVNREKSFDGKYYIRNKNNRFYFYKVIE